MSSQNVQNVAHTSTDSYTFRCSFFSVAKIRFAVAALELQTTQIQRTNHHFKVDWQWRRTSCEIGANRWLWFSSGAFSDQDLWRLPASTLWSNTMKPTRAAEHGWRNISGANSCKQLQTAQENNNKLLTNTDFTSQQRFDQIWDLRFSSVCFWFCSQDPSHTVLLLLHVWFKSRVREAASFTNWTQVKADWTYDQDKVQLVYSLK